MPQRTLIASWSDAASRSGFGGLAEISSWQSNIHDNMMRIIPTIAAVNDTTAAMTTTETATATAMSEEGMNAHFDTIDAKHKYHIKN